jgi:hypothetical protein
LLMLPPQVALRRRSQVILCVFVDKDDTPPKLVAV